jgi:hypothetical protein
VVLVEVDVDPPPPAAAAGAALPFVLLMRSARLAAAAIAPTASKAPLVSQLCARCTPDGYPGLNAPSPAKAELETITVPAKTNVAMQRIKNPQKKSGA